MEYGTGVNGLTVISDHLPNLTTSQPILQKKTCLQECWDLLKLAIPILAAQFCSQALVLVDSIMAAQAGEIELAAISLGGAFWATVILLCLGIPSTMAPIVAHLKGAKNCALIAPTVHNAWYPLVIITVFCMLVVIFLPKYFLIAVGTEENLVHITQKYLWFVAPAIPAIVIIQVIKNTLEGLTITRPGMIVSFGAVLLNIPLNYYCINGLTIETSTTSSSIEIISPMGAVGCGVATSIVTWLGALALFICARTIRATKELKLFSKLEKFDLKTIKMLLVTGMPISFSFIVESFSYSAIGYATANFGSRIIAAHQIANIVCIMVFMLPLALSNAVAIKTGYALGKQSTQKLISTAKAGLIVSLALILTCAFIVFSFRYEIISCFTLVPETTAIAAPLFICILIYQLQDAFYGTGLGILRGFRDNTVMLLINFVILWCLVIPFAIYLGFFAPQTVWPFNLGTNLDTGYGLYGFWIALVAGYFLISGSFWVRIKFLFKNSQHFVRYH